MKELIRKLVEAWGPSGFEHHVRALIEAEVKDLCDEMSVDALGNLVCRVGKKTDTNKRIMVAAHMDEIGMMVSHIDRRGYMRFTSLGGLFPVTLTGNRVKFEDGTIGTVHVEDFWKSGNSSMPKLDQFFIDVSEDTHTDEQEKNINGNIQVGDVASFWRTMDERGHRLIAKAMDDRIGCVVAIEAMRQVKEVGTPHEVYFVFTVQEEVGTRGSKTSAYSVDPDLGIALDVTVAGDLRDDMSDVQVGKGAAIKMKDGGLIVPPKVRQLMIDLAEANHIPYQREILLAGGTDAQSIFLNKAGVPSGCISIPCRYVHTVSETVDIRDVQACVDLLVAITSQAELDI